MDQNQEAGPPTNEGGNPEEESRAGQESRGTCTERSLLSLVVGIQRRPAVQPSIDIRGSVSADQTGDERQSVRGSFAVNLSEPVLTRSITLENDSSRAEARIELVEPTQPERPPPSYTSVETPVIPRRPYQHPPPPPTYEQAVGIRYLDRELPFIGVNDPARIWGYRPQPAYCSRCNAMVLTVLETEYCIFTHLTAVTFFICLCWPCVVCPYFIPFFKEVHHFCPACSTFLGCYKPFPGRPHRSAQRRG